MFKNHLTIKKKKFNDYNNRRLQKLNKYMNLYFTYKEIKFNSELLKIFYVKFFEYNCKEEIQGGNNLLL